MCTKLFCTIVLIILVHNIFASIYYIDASTGNDANTGLTQKNAWKTFDKANNFPFMAGDRILLKGGITFVGSLKLKSLRGKRVFPVIISSYGSGRAIISSGDSAAINSISCEYLMVKNLICKGSGRLIGNKANGVDFRQSPNVVIDSVDVSGYLYSGVRITGGSNIRITNVYAHDNGFCGIYVTADHAGNDDSQKKAIRNVYIGHSVAENNPGCPAIKDNHSGNGILVSGVSNTLIEYCEAMNNGWDMPRVGNGPVGIWTYQSDRVIIQHCYSHHNKTSKNGLDGGGFDFDGGVTNSIMQYNLSENNEGAGYGMFQYAGADIWNNNIVRYNISFNDGQKNGQCGIFMWCDPAAVAMKNLHAYNNTIVNKNGYGVNFLPGNYTGFIFENNIYLITDSAKQFIGGNYTGATFNQNLYWSSFHANAKLPQPKISLDNNALVINPMLVLPESDLLGKLNPGIINSTPYFKLKADSPAKKAGKQIIDNGEKDYWGHIIPIPENPNMGAQGD